MPEMIIAIDTAVKFGRFCLVSKAMMHLCFCAACVKAEMQCIFLITPCSLRFSASITMEPGDETSCS